MAERKNVTFAGGCPGGVVGLTIDDSSFVLAGEVTKRLEAGTYTVFYRFQGLPGALCTINVTKGGTMASVNRTVPADGRGAGTRRLVVA